VTPEEYNLVERAASRIDAYAWNALVTRGVRALQEENGLIVDGKCGPKTQQALFLSLSSLPGAAPIPETRAQMLALYGNYKYTIRYRTRNGQKRYAGIRPDPAWVAQNIVQVRLHTGQARRMHRLIAKEFADLFEEACVASGYTPRSVQTYVPRHKNWNPVTSLSCHSFGLAFDIDPALNGMHDENAKIYSHPEWIETFKSAGWTFGGDFRYVAERNKEKRGGDPMHCQRAGRRC